MKQICLIKSILATALLTLLIPGKVQAQDDEIKTMDLYGFIMMDAGYNFDQIHPDWFDVVRPTKLPAFKNEFAMQEINKTATTPSPFKELVIQFGSNATLVIFIATIISYFFLKKDWEKLYLNVACTFAIELLKPSL